MSKSRFVLIALIILNTEPILADHGYTQFAIDKQVKYLGTVVEYNWVNPHVHLVIKVPEGAADPSTEGTWDIEAASASIMGRQGWNTRSYKPGDPITLVAHPLKDGAKGASLFYAIRPDGTRLYQDIARPHDPPKDK